MSYVLHRNLASSPPLAQSAAGIRIRLADGREIIDGSSGPAVSCLGHGHPRVTAAVRAQVERLAYAHTGFFSTEPAEALAELLVDAAQGPFSRAIFVSSGSEGVEVALKLARQYQVEIGEPQRTHVVARRQSYHGSTINALAAGGHVNRRSIYEPLFGRDFSHVSPCYAYRDQADGEADQAYVARLIGELEAEFLRVGPDRVMAFCAETVVGATAGCLEPVPGYFRGVREVCDRYGVLLILDEVMSGMGRTGTLHAWEQEGVAPDLQVIAKGLGGGYQPIGGVLVGHRIVSAIADGSGFVRHGQTYQAHPVACAAALEVQRVIAEEQLLANVARMGRVLGEALAARLGEHPFVGDIRGRGLFWAIELVRDREAKTPFPPELKMNELIRDHALEFGLATYPSGGTIDGRRGDHVMISPPYIVGPDDIEQIVDLLGVAVERAARTVGL